MNQWKILPYGGDIRRNAPMLAQLTITMIDHDGIVTVDPTTLAVELSEDRERIIDAVEAAVLRWREGATRTLTTTYLNTLSHKKALQAQASLGGQLTGNATPYRVDGEIGRLTFPTDALTLGSKTLANSATDGLAALGAREYYRRIGRRWRSSIEFATRRSTPRRSGPRQPGLNAKARQCHARWRNGPKRDSPPMALIPKASR